MPDYMYLLESRLSAEQRAVLVRMQELGAATSSNIYLSGGAVRDVISGMPIRDLDFTVEGNPTRIIRELEKGGAEVIEEDEKLRYAELIFAGDVDGSVSAARDEVYVRPGTVPEIRWSTIMEDLRRRDFSINAIAISLNPASRGLLLDPTNGLSDLEKHELRGLSIHSFTNQPVRLLRSLRFAARLGLKFETRTKEWFDLAMDRELYKQITPEEAGEELKQLAREDKPGAALKAWETSGLLHSVAPRLAKKHPHYDAIARLVRSRDELLSAGLRPRLSVPTAAAILGKLKSRDLSAVLHRARFRAPDIAAILKLEAEGKKLVKLLISRKTAVPRDAYTLLEATPMELVGYVLAESKNTKAKAQIRNYISKWRPLRMNLPSVTTELEALGMERGPKFDKVVEDFFSAQLKGKAKLPEERVKILRKLSGIKEVPKKEEKKKPVKAAPSKGATKIEAMQAAKVRAAAANAVPGGKHVQVSKKKSAPKKAAKSAPKKSKPSGKKASSSKKRK
jgi:tRNA nucleotidyltransferase/poly(A) polymerase